MPEKNHSVPVISFNIKDTESETVAKILNDNYNIAVRAGLHCAPLAHKSFGTQDTGTVRAVVSAFTDKNDVIYLKKKKQTLKKKIQRTTNLKKQFKKVAISNKSMLE